MICSATTFLDVSPHFFPFILLHHSSLYNSLGLSQTKLAHQMMVLYIPTLEVVVVTTYEQKEDKLPVLVFSTEQVDL